MYAIIKIDNLFDLQGRVCLKLDTLFVAIHSIGSAIYDFV